MGISSVWKGADFTMKPRTTREWDELAAYRTPNLTWMISRDLGAFGTRHGQGRAGLVRPDWDARGYGPAKSAPQTVADDAPGAGNHVPGQGVTDLPCGSGPDSAEPPGSFVIDVKHECIGVGEPRPDVESDRCID